MFRTEYPTSRCRSALSMTTARCIANGTMRLATAADEIHPLRDAGVQQNEAYLIVIILARVITSLGTVRRSIRRSSRGCMRPISPTCRSSTTRSTEPARRPVEAACPHCEHDFSVALNGVGGS